MNVVDLLPRRADGLPPGQRQVRTLPRFSDKPLRWAPTTGAIGLAVSIEGSVVATLDAEALAGFDQVEQTSDFHCVTTWSVVGLRWGGVRLTDVLDHVVDGSLPPYLSAAAADGCRAVFVTEDLMAPDVLLATRLDGQLLDRRHGAPLRLVSPGQYGYKSVKHLTGIDLSTHQPASMFGPKEHLRARVDHEERHATRPSWLVKPFYRLAILPTALAAERGLRRSPD